MPSLKEVKNRISSVQNTRKITSAMRMVASAKLHRAQGAIERMLPYQNRMDEILTRFLANNHDQVRSPYTRERLVKRVALVAFSSNHSMCGAFNANVTKQLLRSVEKYETLGKENILIFTVGKKVEDEVRKHGYELQATFQEMADKPTYEESVLLANQLMELFAHEQVDKVEFIFHHFKSMGSQELMTIQYLPIDLKKLDNDVSDKPLKVDYIIEPSTKEFIADLLPQVLNLNVFTALLDSSASEHAARAMSMQVATDNANELIEELSRQYNKSRQQSITNELLDIVGGSMR
ncbi:F0F1 ATP synthase subunit gamma [Bacteroides sp. OttesenSCG-928-N06]|nr:F0F1 ATP synthase subunit gamma [Bacteroides sp. OttesenSCG-928-N06]